MWVNEKWDRAGSERSLSDLSYNRDRVCGGSHQSCGKKDFLEHFIYAYKKLASIAKLRNYPSKKAFLIPGTEVPGANNQKLFVEVVDNVTSTVMPSLKTDISTRCIL